MELSDYLRVLRAHWVGVAVCVLLAVAASAVYTIAQPKVYAANATGFVSAGDDSNPALGSVADSLAKSRAKSYVDIAMSRATARSVIAKLGLDADPAALIGSISVDQPLDTVLVKITARASTPRGAQQLADAWVTALAKQVATIEDPRHKNQPGTLKIVPVESAELPSAPISPRSKLNLLIGLVAGALLGVAYALVRNQLDRRLRSASAIEKQFGVTVVGAIPAAGDLAHDPGKPAAIAVRPQTGDTRPSESAEAFRKLRTNLQFMDVDNPPRVIVLTSPQQGDGKSTIAANLAAALAVTGEKVTLVDGDLRRPTVAESFGLVEGAGLTDVLVGRVTVEDVIQQHPDHPNLRVLAAGGTPPNPSELLGSQTMKKLLRQLARQTVVVVDAPPLLPVTDAAVLTAVSDGAFVVISSGRTLDTELGAALGQLEAVRGKPLGVIINRVPRRGSESGYYGGSYESRARGAKQLGSGDDDLPASDLKPASLAPTKPAAKPAPRPAAKPAGKAVTTSRGSSSPGRR